VLCKLFVSAVPAGTVQHVVLSHFDRRAFVAGAARGAPIVDEAVNAREFGRILDGLDDGAHALVMYRLAMLR